MLDKAVGGTGIVQQQTRGEPELGQQRDDILRRRYRLRDSRWLRRGLRREQRVDQGDAVRGLAQAARETQMLGDGDVVISAEEHEGHVPQHQFVRHREDLAAVQVNVQDRGLGCFRVPSGLLQRRHRSKDDGAHVGEEGRE
ncbi:MAG: hypothetical protein E5X69_26275, partial [Mesorhizobium sp.]